MALSQQEKDVKDLVDEVKTLYTERQNLLSPDERNAGWNEGNLTPRQLLSIQELLQSGIFEQATLNDVAKAVGYSPESFSQTLSGARQQALEMDTPQETTGMALPEELTNIPINNNYSMDEAAIIEQLISSGQLSVSQVSDYFGLPAADINRVLSQDFGYTPEQVAQVAQPSPLTGTVANTPVANTPAAVGPMPSETYVPPVQPTLTPTATNTSPLANIPSDGNYSMEDATAVENAIKTGQVTTQQVSDYFNVPVADINRVLETDFGYTPEQTAQAVTGLTPATTETATTPAATDTTTTTLPEALNNIAVDGNYSMADAEIVEGLIRSGQVTTQQVADRFGLPVNDINRVLSTDFGYTGDQLNQALSGGGVQGEVTRPATQTTQTTQGTQGGQTTTNEPIVGGLAGRTTTGAASQNVFAPIAGQAATGNQAAFPTGGANMPQTGVIGAEAALQGGLAGGLAGLQQGIGEARTGLVGSSQEAMQTNFSLVLLLALLA